MDKNKFIITESETYLRTQNKTLEQRLSKVEISKEGEKEIIENKTLKIIRDKVLGSFKVGDVISTVLNWNEEVDEEIKEAKKAVLLEQYFNLVDNHDNAINELKQFITSPQGNVLFNKVLKILDDNPPDLELIGHLSSALKYIVSDEYFYKMFEKHKFALSQIEGLSPQALTILSDYKNYPTFHIGAVTTIGAKVSTEWNNQFVNAYCMKKGITSIDITTRISHVIVQLQTQGYIEAYKSKEDTFYCEITKIGKDLLPYITC